MDPYSLPESLHQSLSTDALVEIDSNPVQNHEGISEQRSFQNNLRIDPNAPKPENRRFSLVSGFSPDMPQFAENDMNFKDLPPELDSSTFRDNFGSMGDITTNLASLPEFDPGTIPLSNFDLNDPAALPELPAFPEFNLDNKRPHAPVPKFSTHRNHDLTSVTDMLLSGDLDKDLANLPQIPSQSLEDSIIAPEMGSFSSSGYLPQVVPRAQESNVNSDGLLTRNCKICDRPVEFDGLFANGYYFHRTCARCPKCQIQLAPPNCVLFKDKLFCVNCAQKKDELKLCPICNLPLDGFQKELTIAKLNIAIHTNCLCCYECSRNLAKGQQEILSGKILCKRCANVAKQRVCGKCNQPIVGEFKFCHKKYYHPEHFVCLICNVILHGNNYKMHHNKLLCSKHSAYFQQHCAYCKRALYLTDELLIKWKGKLYHKVCFVCRVCGCELFPEQAKSFHCRPHCEACYRKRKSEEIIGIDHKSQHHIPSVSRERRQKYMEDGINVRPPKYGNKKEQFLEVVIKDQPIEEPSSPLPLKEFDHLILNSLD